MRQVYGRSTAYLGTMEHSAKARHALQRLDGALVGQLLEQGRLLQLPHGSTLLQEGAYVRDLPIVVEGLVRVFLHHEDRELLLYYIEPAESCVMSFSALLHRTPSRIHAVAEGDVFLLLVPETAVRSLLREYPAFGELLLELYGDRYMDLLRTMEQVAFGDLPTRLLEHLRRLAVLRAGPLLDVRHAQLARELGSAREVITRTLAKLEREGWVEVLPNGILLKR